jgi:uncharacterized membrane protein
MTYTLLKLAHIVGVVLFLGNITTGLFWAAFAHGRRDFALIASTFQGIIQSDRWFTIPGVFAILIGGFGAAINGSIPILRTGWVLWPSLLFLASGIIFGSFVAPLQRKIHHFVGHAPQTEDSWSQYCSIYKRWEIWGLLAWLAPVLALIIMVLKLPLPGI